MEIDTFFPSDPARSEQNVSDGRMSDTEDFYDDAAALDSARCKRRLVLHLETLADRR